MKYILSSWIHVPSDGFAEAHYAHPEGLRVYPMQGGYYVPPYLPDNGDVRSSALFSILSHACEYAEEALQ